MGVMNSIQGARPRGVFRLRVLRGGADGHGAADAERTYTSAGAEGLRRGIRLMSRTGTAACERSSGVAVVDEDARTLGAVERALASGGYGARAYPDADAAFGALLREPCRVLIVAGRMKRGDGWTFAERARTAGCASSVIMMTGAREAVNVYGMLRSGKINGYIKKPLTVGELMDKLSSIMDPTTV